MQGPDVKVLVNAIREDATHHDRCRGWLLAAVSGWEQVGLSELVLSGALRLLTHPRVFHPATPDEDATTFEDALLAQPASVRLQPRSGHWRICRGPVGNRSLTGSQIPGAYHAALAIEHGCERATLDRGFSVYPGLRPINLLASGAR